MGLVLQVWVWFFGSGVVSTGQVLLESSCTNSTIRPEGRFQPYTLHKLFALHLPTGGEDGSRSDDGEGGAPSDGDGGRNGWLFPGGVDPLRRGVHGCSVRLGAGVHADCGGASSAIRQVGHVLQPDHLRLLEHAGELSFHHAVQSDTSAKTVPLTPTIAISVERSVTDHDLRRGEVTLEARKRGDGRVSDDDGEHANQPGARPAPPVEQNLSHRCATDDVVAWPFKNVEPIG